MNLTKKFNNKILVLLLLLLSVGVGDVWGAEPDASLNFNLSTWGYYASKSFSDGSTATFEGGGVGDLNESYITLATNATLTITSKSGSYIGAIVVYFSDSGDKEFTFNDYSVPGTSSVTWIPSNKTLTSAVIKCSTGANITKVDLYYMPVVPVVTLTSAANQTISLGSTLTLGANISSGFHTWDLYEDADLTNKLGFLSYNSSITIDPQNGIKDNNGNTLKSGKGTYYIVAGAGREIGSGSYQWAEGKLYTISVDCINESRTITSSGTTREYWLHVPASVKGNTSTAVPVVFSLHGGNCDYEPSNEGVQNFNDLADANGFIVVYPRAIVQTLPKFNGGNACRCWNATGTENDDMQFLRDILTALKNNTTEFKVDASRVYITGFSNGGMMTYAAANTASDIFAAFASISGYPINETHLQHNGPRAVPFLHIHGKNDDFVKYTKTPTIIDNMVARNGLSYTPTTTVNGSGYDYYAYEATGKQPYYFYAIDGVGHTCTTTIGSKSSREVIWEFFSGKTLNTATSTVEFAPDVNTANTTAADHGWTICNTNSTDEKVIAKYGESGGYTDSGMNVYHSIQLKAGTHHLNFTASNSDPTKHVNVKLIKLGALSNFSTVNVTGFTVGTDETVNQSYYTDGVISYSFTTDEAAEYQLVFTKESQYDGTTISNVSITTDGTDSGHTAEYPLTTAGETYFKYRNRLAAQWNFDKCDTYRFTESTASASGSKWTEADDNYYNGEGTKTFTYNEAIGESTATDVATLKLESSYKELTYNGTAIVPITSELKFLSPKDNIKIIVNYAGYKTTGVNLVVNEKVKMFVPYVINTYRNDKGEDDGPYEKETTDWAGVKHAANLTDYENCMHHIKRDILCTFPKEGNTWTHLSNKCIDAGSKTLFNAGGNELADGLYFDKLNYTGNDGTPCVMQFTRPISFNRIGVNRNLTYSFYPEYIADISVDRPSPHTSIEANPSGQKIANLSSSSTTYNKALKMTFGGWKNTSNSNIYDNYAGNSVTDSWSVPDESYDASSIAVDGFTYASQNSVYPTSESLMPSSTTGNTYHPACTGIYTTAYTANYTPWSLPCRGAYLKFEPTIPGVLNVDVVQSSSAVYYITDEFGNTITDGVFCKTSSETISTADNGFTAGGYVKYSYNVYPGKTYYMFSPSAGIGFAGFYFEPYVYRKSASDEMARQDVELASLTLEDGKDYSEVTIPSSSTRAITSPGTNKDVSYEIYSDNKAVSVTLDRSFKANTWNSICLPFSMNQNAMETVFGKGTQVILLRDVQPASKMSSKKTTANFIAHENQDIIAGYPYLIRPTQKVSSISTNAYIPETVSIPTISGQGFKTTTGVSIDTDNYGGLSYYTFKGTFANVTVPKGSYYINTSGSLSRCTNDAGVAIKPYRAYLELTESSNYAKALDAVYFGNPDDDLITGIDEVQLDDFLLEQGIVTKSTNVYNMQGQVVRQNATTLQGLPKGAYIVNGKKYIVK